jgi:ABC-2 type transport system permease protein
MVGEQIIVKSGSPLAGLAPLLLVLRVNRLSTWRRIQSLKQHSPLLTGVIALFISSYLVLAFWLFYKGLKFIGDFPGFGALLVERLLFLLFAFLFVLLLLSNLVVGYTNLFRNRETSFLISLPVPTRTIFQWKFIESTVLASWAFVFLIAPLLAAYGLNREVSWHFYPVTVVLVGLFIVLPAVAGSWLAVNLARYLDRRLFQVIAVTGLIAMLAGAAWWFRPGEPIPDDLDTRVLPLLKKVLGRTFFAEFPLLPSYWLSASVVHWSESGIAAARFFMLVLLSHVLFFASLALTRMGGLFYDAMSAVNSRGSVLGRWKWFASWREQGESVRLDPGPLEKFFGQMRWLRPDVRALMIKDTRMFWRDTTQWAQSLMLFGLLGVYIFNLRHFSQQLVNPFWIHLVSYLNLGACSLNLATLTTRFVYPQFSLEGKRLWIVGLAPLGMEQIVKTKFWLSTVTSLIVTIGLITLSCYMLRMPFGRTLYFVGTVTVMTLTLTGLAVGLGALYPNFKEENPSKIVSGFGGTFCLVLSFLYILTSVIVLAFSAPWGGQRADLRGATCTGVFLFISLVLGYLPMRFGLRRVRTVEL